MSSRFLQIHTLTAWPAALLNRDDAGFAKRISFGGAVRTRVSSQCLKRHWRVYEGPGGFQALGLPATVRSRETLHRRVYLPLVDAGLDKDRVAKALEVVKAEVFGESEKAKAKKGGTEKEAGKTEQVTVLGELEIAHIRSLVERAVAHPGDAAESAKAVFTKDERANLHSLARGSGLGAAMFGRMITSDILARGDAAVHVAHAFTVHEEEKESDYFSAVDDLVKEDGELGSGHIGNADLASGLYYGYVVVDIELLVRNLGGDREAAAGAVAALVRLIATVTPGAKLGSTAPYARASVLVAEAGDETPRSFANAWLRPVSGPDLLGAATGALEAHVQRLDRVYGGVPRAAISLLDDDAGFAIRMGAEPVGSLTAVADWARAAVQ